MTMQITSRKRVAFPGWHNKIVIYQRIWSTLHVPLTSHLWNRKNMGKVSSRVYSFSTLREQNFPSPRWDARSSFTTFTMTSWGIFYRSAEICNCEEANIDEFNCMQFATKFPKYAIIWIFIMYLASRIHEYVCGYVYLLRVNMMALCNEWAHKGATSTWMRSKHVTMPFYECCAPTTTPTATIIPC